MANSRISSREVWEFNELKKDIIHHIEKKNLKKYLYYEKIKRNGFLFSVKINKKKYYFKKNYILKI